MKQRHHEIDLEGLQYWLAESEFMFASSSRERKRLVATINGNLKVIVAGTIVWQGTQPFSAVEAYNAVTEKYIDEAANFKL